MKQASHYYCFTVIVPDAFSLSDCVYHTHWQFIGSPVFPILTQVAQISPKGTYMGCHMLILILNTNSCWKISAGIFFLPPCVCKEKVIKELSVRCLSVLEMTVFQALLSLTAHLNLVKYFSSCLERYHWNEGQLA